MRILIIDAMALRGGQERHILHLLDRLGEHQVEVGLALSEESPWLDEANRLIPEHIYCLDYSTKFSSPTITKLKDIVRKGNYQLIHSHGGRGGIYGRRVGSSLGVPVVNTWHLNPDDWAGSRRFRQLAYTWGERVLSRDTDHYVAVSDPIRRTLVSRYHVPEGDITTIVNRVPRPSRLAKVSRNPGERAFRLLCAGRLTDQKGFSVLLDAVRRLRAVNVPIVVKIAGEGEQFTVLSELANKMGLSDCVEFLGFVSPLDPWMDWADVFVLPSLWEGTPLVILEAMAHGLRVVATRVGGVPNQLRGYLSHVLVSPGDSVELAHAIEASRDLEVGVAKDLSLFDVDQMVNEYVQVFRTVLAAHQRKQGNRIVSEATS